MQIIILLIAISISLALFFLISFLWATRTGQYDDTYGPSVRLLHDDEIQPKEVLKPKSTTAPCK